MKKKAEPDSEHRKFGERALKNQHLFFVHASLDDRKMPYHEFRLLCHLSRRIGSGDVILNPGIRTMATVCRMEKRMIIKALNRLEFCGYIQITRANGTGHKYAWLLDKSFLFVHSLIDDFGLSVTEFRVLGHMARIANENGHFFIKKSKFSRICGLNRETLSLVLSRLEGKDLYSAYYDRKDPVYVLTLCDRFKDAQIKKGPAISNGQEPASKSMWRKSVTVLAERRNGMTEISNGECRKAVTEGAPSEGINKVIQKKGIQHHRRASRQWLLSLYLSMRKF